MSIFTRMQHFTADPTFDMVVGKLMCFLSPELSNEERARYATPPDPQPGHLPGAAIIRATDLTSMVFLMSVLPSTPILIGGFERGMKVRASALSRMWLSNGVSMARTLRS